MDTPQRWFLFWLWAASSFCILGALVGCSDVTPSASTLSAPVFLPCFVEAQARVESSMVKITFDVRRPSMISDRDSLSRTWGHIIPLTNVA